MRNEWYHGVQVEGAKDTKTWYEIGYAQGRYRFHVNPNGQLSSLGNLPPTRFVKLTDALRAISQDGFGWYTLGIFKVTETITPGTPERRVMLLPGQPAPKEAEGCVVKWALKNPYASDGLDLSMTSGMLWDAERRDRVFGKLDTIPLCDTEAEAMQEVACIVSAGRGYSTPLIRAIAIVPAGEPVVTRTETVLA
jgi:hypothetical protein